MITSDHAIVTKQQILEINGFQLKLKLLSTLLYPDFFDSYTLFQIECELIGNSAGSQ
jgi:hypothetical protein